MRKLWHRLFGCPHSKPVRIGKLGSFSAMCVCGTLYLVPIYESPNIVRNGGGHA